MFISLLVPVRTVLMYLCVISNQSTRNTSSIQSNKDSGNEYITGAANIFVFISLVPVRVMLMYLCDCVRSQISVLATPTSRVSNLQ